MCLFAVVYQILPNCPILILANREESRDRPSLTPRWNQSTIDHMHWFGGVDQIAGGTWLGLNQAGLIVAVTNRPKPCSSQYVRSRGLLCRDLLACQNAASARDQTLHQLESRRFSGFNLLMLDQQSGFVVSHAEEEVTVSPLERGIHVITNGSLDDFTDRRIVRVHHALDELINTPHSFNELLQHSQRICGFHADADWPEVCVDHPQWGTVSSTIIAVSDDSSHRHYHFADGPPCRTPYRDLSADAQKSFPNPAPIQQLNTIHRIRLRGPWLFEWISSQSDASHDELERSGRVKLPATWTDCFGDRSGTVSLSRVFHRPSNLDADEHVVLVFSGIGGDASVTLNGHPLGEVSDGVNQAEFDITADLQNRNEIRVQLTHDPLTAAKAPGGLYGPVILEIRRDQAARAVGETNSATAE